ncbi:hypothetical protein ANN_24866 [Periplaneta americana]|uniref:Uncharacterized protein n=1 Tax=Periplaneta americana TaxID=6978 RepID=A0ABQ8RZX6_PERAM|nr:hypothetical protein ANN_24866 [Periplaneta americana]
MAGLCEGGNEPPCSLKPEIYTLHAGGGGGGGEDDDDGDASNLGVKEGQSVVSPPPHSSQEIMEHYFRDPQARAGNIQSGRYYSKCPPSACNDVLEEFDLRFQHRQQVRLPADPEMGSDLSSVPAKIDYLIRFFFRIFANYKANVRFDSDKESGDFSPFLCSNALDETPKRIVTDCEELVRWVTHDQSSVVKICDNALCVSSRVLLHSNGATSLMN